jgi:outer membrane protein assembly factor BamA
MRVRAAIVALGALAMLGTPAWAQDTADVKVDAAQAPPERDADSAELGFVAKARRWAEEHKIAERIAPREGLYVRFGGMVTGSGFAMGPGYRRYFGAADDQFFDVSAAISAKAYKAFDAKGRVARFWNDRVELWSEFRYRDYPQEDFFGLGEDAPLEARTNYSMEATDVLGRGLINLSRWLRVGADIGYFNPDVGHGSDDAWPSIEEVYTDAVASGLDEQPNFLHNTVFAEIDYRDNRGNPNRGGFYRVSVGTWEDVTLEAFDHHRLDAEASQFFPVSPKQVVAVHVGLSYVNNESGDRVPFYFLPHVGGSDTVRGFREYRFRDENVLFMNLEYRLKVHRFVHIAPFFDAGEVRADWEDIGPGDLKTSYGIGFRGGTEEKTFIRLDIGTGGDEGTRIFFKFGPSF